MKAKRGDGIVVESKPSYTIQRPGSGVETVRATEFTFGVVTNINRDGLALRYRPVGWTTTTEVKGLGYVRHYVVSKAEFDVEGILTAAAEHSWPGHPDQPRPFADIEEVRTLALPYKRAT